MERLSYVGCLLLETRFVFLFLRDNKEIKDNNEIKVKKNSKKISAYQPNFQYYVQKIEAQPK